jgi:hypothetical protein
VAHAGAAVALGHHGPEPAHLRDALPEVPVVALVRLEHRAAHREVRMLREIVARGLLDELLFLGEVEIHARGLPSIDPSIGATL